MQQQPILQMKDIVKEFPGVKALDGVNLELYEGKVMGILGENGAGKSTLMKILSGVYKKDSGEIYYKGVLEEIRGPKDAQLKGISIIHQELNLIKDLSIGENVFLGREPMSSLGKIDWKKLHKDTNDLLRKLNLNNDSKELVKNLSIGKQQMIEIAKALSLDAKIIIMDEPTAALTETESESLFNVIEELKNDGKSIVYISHRLKEIFKICDYVTALRDGKYVGTEDTKNLTEDKIIEMMVGRKLTEQYPSIEVPKGEVVLEVKNLSNEYINDVSFKLHKGEILGISGLMGSGRTELAKTIYGYYKLNAGEIYVEGKKINNKSSKDALKNKIAYVSEDRKGDGLVISLSVKENMSLSSLDRLSNLLKIKKEEELQEVNEYVKKMNIKTPGIKQIVKNLSGGNQQKVSIGKSLMTNPEVLILDEPTRGIDVGAKKEIYDIINQLKEMGKGIIIISSEMPEILGMSDRILVLSNGRITGEFNKGEASQENIMKSAVATKEV